MLLELIFGQNIESCPLRRHYYGVDNKPNDQTDICTARKWSTKVLGECGPEIADVVRRCLDCSFGPRPNLVDRRFQGGGVRGRDSAAGGVFKDVAAGWDLLMLSIA